MKNQISITVDPSMSPRIENWLMGRDIEYEVDTVGKKGHTRLKIIARFPMDDQGEHQAELYGRFLDRIKKGGA